MRSALEWAQVADGVSEREIARRLGINRRTVARLAASEEPLRYRRAPHRATSTSAAQVAPGLPPYGLSDILRLPADARREVTLVEGLIDVHHLRSKGSPLVAAIGGARAQPEALQRFGRLGIDSVVLALDNDASGRDGTARAVERITRLADAPALRVLDPERLGDSKDPDAFVREHGVASFVSLVAESDCAVGWCAREFVNGITPESELGRRRAALARAGRWLGTLPPRYALEQEDAIRQVAERCGYSRDAVERAFRARFWERSERRGRVGPVMER